MKGLEINLDGVNYFVTADTRKSYQEYGVTLVVKLSLYLGTMRSKCIYSELDRKLSDANDFDEKKAKKFIKRALAYDPKKK